MNPVERQALQLQRIKEFDRVTYDTRIKAGESQKFTFTYNADPQNIEGFKIHCKTCTTVRREGNVFHITFSAPPKSDYAKQIAQGDKQSQYTSAVSVYFKDGQQIQLYDKDGQLKDNPDKVAVSLQIRATIEFA